LAQAAIELVDVTKSFAGTVAVKDMNFRIEQGEFFTFLGPSGCGKTTLLRMIAGFETPSEGQILISGRNMIKVPPHKRPVNTVFQSYALFPHLSVTENVCFGLRSSGRMDKSESLDRAKRALTLVRLEHLARRYPSELSGGQQQRVALARAIVNEPAVLLLDEPLSALDPQIREDMQSELSRLQRELNMTFIMVTHDQSEALALSHRIAVFCQGNLEQVGRPEEIFAAPQTKFVAEFIGQSNLLPCDYLQFNQGVHSLRFADGNIFNAVSGCGFAFKHGDRCFVAVKPQQFTIFNSPDRDTDSSGAGNRMRGTIVHASYKGSSTEYLIRVQDLNIRVETSRNREGLEVGTPVIVEFPVETPWLLPGDSPETFPQSDKRITSVSLAI